MTEHFVQFYEDDKFLITQIAAFIRSGLRAGDAVIVIATKQHREDLEKRLSEDLWPPGMPPPGADQYIVLDADDTFSKFMVGGQPNMQNLAEMVGPILKRASGDGVRGVRVAGEMVGLLAANGDHESAIRLEEFWNNLADASPRCAIQSRSNRFRLQDRGRLILNRGRAYLHQLHIRLAAD